MKLPNLVNCHDCGVEPGYTHLPGCDVEMCSHCGGQVLMCGGCVIDGTMRHDPCFARWTGLHPGVAEATAMGMFSKWSAETGWVKTTASDPEGHADLNTFIDMGYQKIFFVKPTKENGREL